jgi:hypothetical protein
MEKIKILPLPGNEPQMFRLVACHYTELLGTKYDMFMYTCTCTLLEKITCSEEIWSKPKKLCTKVGYEVLTAVVIKNCLLPASPWFLVWLILQP